MGASPTPQLSSPPQVPGGVGSGGAARRHRPGRNRRLHVAPAAHIGPRPDGRFRGPAATAGRSRGRSGRRSLFASPRHPGDPRPGGARRVVHRAGPGSLSSRQGLRRAALCPGRRPAVRGERPAPRVRRGAGGGRPRPPREDAGGVEEGRGHARPAQTPKASRRGRQCPPREDAGGVEEGRGHARPAQTPKASRRGRQCPPREDAGGVEEGRGHARPAQTPKASRRGRQCPPREDAGGVEEGRGHARPAQTPKASRRGRQCPPREDAGGVEEGRGHARPAQTPKASRRGRECTAPRVRRGVERGAEPPSPKGATMKVVDAIAEILKREGVEFLSTYPTTPLIDAVAAAGIRPVLCRQERVGVGIADGFTRTANGRRIGVFAMQYGPGAENAFPGVATVYSDSVPILVLPLGHQRDRAQVFPLFSSARAYASVTKWVETLNQPEQVAEVMRRAFNLLKMGRPGPVMVEIPADVAVADVPDQLALQYKPVKATRPSGDARDVAAATRVLLEAKKPIIHAGQGVMYAEACTELLELAEFLKIPVMTTLEGKSAFPEDHPLALGTGGGGVMSGPSHHFLSQAD